MSQSLSVLKTSQIKENRKKSFVVSLYRQIVRLNYATGVHSLPAYTMRGISVGAML